MRSKKLKALSSEELSLENLRSLFRLLDDDGSGEVSANEIKRGLILLGFPEAHDPVALSRVVGEIDDDNTGTITEGEFLTFFGSQTRATLGRLLKGYVLNHTYILATTYGVFGRTSFPKQGLLLLAVVGSCRRVITTLYVGCLIECGRSMLVVIDAA